MGAGQKGSGALTYRIVITPQALKMLKAIPDRRIREKINVRIDGLAEEPQNQGKPLMGVLAGYRSLRCGATLPAHLSSPGGQSLGARGRFRHPQGRR